MSDNISIRYPNFTVDDGYFYTFDPDQDALLMKTADGNTAFSYPCDTLITNDINSLEYDGVYFWTMEDGEDSGITIKRWLIDNYITKLQETFEIEDTGTHTYSADCFTVEHYHTTLTTAISGGETTIYLDDYTNEPNIIDDSTLYIGPNDDGDSQEVEVTDTVYGGVVIGEAMDYAFDAGAEVNFHRRLWVFNNYNGSDDSTGALYKFDSHSGDYMEKYPGGAYSSITACTFCSIDSFTDVGEKDMLLYVKGANTLFVNVEEETETLYDADTVNDSFTGDDGDVPNSTYYSVEDGTPTIQSNSLQLDVESSGTEAIQTKYYLPEDFDVYINGTVDTYDSTYSDSDYWVASLKLVFPNEQDRFCTISRGYSTEFGDHMVQNFSSVYRKSEDGVINVVSGTNLQAGADINDFSLRIRRVDDNVHLYYRTTVSGSEGDWLYMGYEEMFDTDAQLIVELENTTDSEVVVSFDKLTYTEGSIAYVSTATELPYYGSMVMDNVADDGYTITAAVDMAVDSNNLYRLEGSSTYDYSLSPLDSFVSSISLTASPAIIAANGLSTTDISAYVMDQFLQPITSRRVTFSQSSDDGSISGGTNVNTDSDGYAQTEYTAGTSAESVTITATVQQTN